MNWFNIGIRSGSPIERAGRTLTLKTFVFQLAFPGGGIIYNRPVAVSIRAEGAPDRTLPIININRLAQVAFTCLGLAALGIASRRMFPHD
jgi:hypothetical protein